MNILILNGGKNLRMDGVPKCLTFIKGRTLFEWQYRWLKTLSKTFPEDPLNICISIGGNKILKDYFRNSFKESFFSDSSFISINTFEEVEPLGDAGAIKYYIKNFNIEGNFLVINGDILSFYDINHLVNFPFEYYGRIVIKPFTVHLGLLQVDRGRIVSFREKPTLSEYETSCGTYSLNSRIFEFLPEKGDFANDVIAKYSDKFSVFSIKEDQWCAVESRKDIEAAEKLIERHSGKDLNG